MAAAQPAAGRAPRALVLAATMMVLGCLAAGCSSAASHITAAVSSVTASRTGAPTTPPTTAPASPSVTVTTTAPSVTVTATASAPHTSASAAATPATSTPSPAGGGSISPAVWTVIGVCAAALAIGLIAWLVHASGRRRAAAAGWRARVADAYEDARTRVSAALAALQAVRSAMSAQRVPGGDEAAKAAAVRERMSFFDAALLDLREPASRPL